MNPPLWTAPVIVIGMHRSGTSMITHLLEQLGLFMGWAQQENSEAMFFTVRNEKLLNLCGGSWERPQPIELLLRNRRQRAEVAEQLNRDLHSIRFLSYLGPRRYQAIEKIDFAWGWKDPRNTFLLPLWLDLFPNARIIHIHRNGLDVARSLVRRETKAEEERGTRGPIRSIHWWKQFREEPILLTASRCSEAVRRRLTPLGRYDRFAVQETCDLRKAFDLWCVYVERCAELAASIPNETVTVRYEDFLLEPAKHLEQLSEFCGLNAGKTEIESSCRNVRKDRRHTFKTDPEAVRVYQSIRENPWMVKLGYGNV